MRVFSYHSPCIVPLWGAQSLLPADQFQAPGLSVGNELYADHFDKFPSSAPFKIPVTMFRLYNVTSSVKFYITATELQPEIIPHLFIAVQSNIAADE